MNDATPIDSAARDATAVAAIGHSACPHDCPSTCALEVDLLAHNRIGRVRGDAGNSYTAGVICAKVARYAERIHHPDRLLKPLIRAGAKGEGKWKEASFDAALDLIAEKFVKAEAEFGSETVWPISTPAPWGWCSATASTGCATPSAIPTSSTVLHQHGLDRLCHGRRRVARPDPREMAKSDCVVIWGTNAVSTQVNVMTHAIRARKERGAKIVVSTSTTIRP
jgi:anaerobic selenocysteine-containing dehydrogenase